MLGFYIFQFLPVVILEAFVLWRLKWGSVWLSSLDSLMMNFASFMGLLLGLGPYISTYGVWGLSLFSFYCVMVEGTVLTLLERHNARKAWLMAVTCNGCTLIMLAIETLVMKVDWGKMP
jgi:hypothetical protein